MSPESSRVRFSPNLRPTEPSRLSGSLIRAAQAKEHEQARAEHIKAWQNVLIPGRCVVRTEEQATAFTAISYDGSTVDVSPLLAIGATLVRSRPDGDTTWTILKHVDPPREGMSYRLQVETVGMRTTIEVAQLMREPDVNGRSWIVPIPTE